MRGDTLKRNRQRRRKTHVDPFRSIEQAADTAMNDVLEEDRLLREHGIFPENGRSR